MTAKEKLREFVERLSEAEAEKALRLLAERRADPVAELFDQAPEDDEPTTPEEDRSAREAWAEYKRRESIPLDKARRELA
jgi:hypothetical protein